MWNNEFSIGVVAALVVTGVLWVLMFWHHAKSNNALSGGGLLIAVGFFSMAYRSYLVLVLAQVKYSNDVMVSLFISAATFLSGTIIISIPYWKK